MDNSYYIHGVNGPVVTVRGGRGLSMLDMVYVGDDQLIGEVVGIRSEHTTVQVYEDTTGLAPGQPVKATGAPMSIQLGPGLIGNIFDGIARPLRAIEAKTGVFMARGVNLLSLDPDKTWETELLIKKDDTVSPGQIFAQCQETSIIQHRVTVPSGIAGTVVSVVENGSYPVNHVVAEVQDEHGRVVSLTLAQMWPIRRPRPISQRLSLDRPLITGQRIIDSLFPIAMGGCAAIPGPFGAGKTITQHQLAKWSNADIIVYLGCGERGNEMTEVLEEFSNLMDPQSGRPLLDRTVLIANTSNMPVAAREASIYTGMTIAEYYRDMGYNVAIMADSTSRWAEALREISGRLEEMPAEEGFPAYLPSRLAEFYERAGYTKTLCGKEGSVTVIGAVSPQGGDFSEPVTQNTKRFIRCFWALDRQLAYARHFPAINWITSYSEYTGELAPWFEKRFGARLAQLRAETLALLQEESKLMEIVKLIGADILPDDQKLIIEAARVIRLGFLQQNAYHATDTYVPIEKQFKMMEIMLYFYERAKELLKNNIPISQLKETGILDKIIRIKYDIPNDKLELFDDYKKQIDESIQSLLLKNK